MPASSHLPLRVTFGPYEVNTATGEFTKRGIRIRLAGQPLDILLVLLARPGEVVSSQELRQKLWPDGTFVDFEHGLHAAINKLRRALDDSAENARYIETVPGSGYRFIGVLQNPELADSPQKTTLSSPWVQAPPPPAAKSRVVAGVFDCCGMSVRDGRLVSEQARARRSRSPAPSHHRCRLR